MKKQKEYTNRNIIFIVVMSSFAAFMITGSILSSIYDNKLTRNLSDLGGAICEEEYGMEFDSYIDGKLYCKASTETKKYDGLIVITT